jgi:CHAD domain-containing protein
LTADLPSPVPKLVDDLPDAAMRDALRPIAWIRALLPGPWIRLIEHRAALRDAAGKIRCRLVAGTALIEPGRERRSAVRVEPLRGYRRDARKITDRVTARFGWPPSSDDPLVALAETLRPTGADRGEPCVTDAAAPAGQALRPVLLALLDTVEGRRRGVVADIDCEELHELRVALRRTRSILALLRAERPDGAQDNSHLDEAAETFAWLGQVTGTTRDLDVHILAWRAHRRTATPEEVAALAPLGTFLMSERDKAHAAMSRALRSRRCRTALERWRAALTAGDEAWSGSEAMRLPIGPLAGGRILKLYRRALREGTVITPETPAEALHALRKTMKKLRYVVEIVREVHPGKRVRGILRTLRELQLVLGDVQDMEVQADALRHFGLAMAATGAAGPATLMAIGAQAEDLEIGRAAARARFAEVFAPVARAKFAARLRALGSPGDRFRPGDTT